MNVSGIAYETFVGASCLAAAHLVCIECANGARSKKRIVRFPRSTGRQHNFLSTSSRSLAYAYKAEEALRERVGLPREILKRGISVCTQKRGIPDPLRELLRELDGVDDFSVTGVLETRNPDIAGLTLAKHFNLASPREALIKAFEVELAQLVYEFGCLAGKNRKHFGQIPKNIIISLRSTLFQLPRMLCEGHFSKSTRGGGELW